MKKLLYIFGFSASVLSMQAQTNPAITSWLQNTSTTGTYYKKGNSTTISNGILVNCQSVKYSNDFAYVATKGIPSYPVGPYLDGNPNQAGDQNAIFKFPLAPKKQTGTLTAPSMGNIGVWINGVAVFDSRDGASWSKTSNAMAGGPLGGTGDGVWNRDAIVYERAGFDCSKGHPAGTNYHTHQNPSAFKNDLNLVSTVCNLYDSDGLYTINNTKHSPLIGFAYDGFPIYGAYGYKNTDGTGEITRIKSGYQFRNISVRTHLANGSDVTDGPVVSTTYPLGSFREDYEWISHEEQDYLDVHNGRFCVTPEYPAGTYAYFATVDENHNSAFPYVIGATFYGVYANRKTTSITETTTMYEPTLSISDNEFKELTISIFPNPASDLIAIQVGDLVKYDLEVKLFDLTGKLVKTTRLSKGSTIAFFDIQTIYEGTYLIKILSGTHEYTQKIIIKR